MLIDTENKFLFVMVPKTGTHVLKELFFKAKMPFGWHATFSDVHKKDKNLYEDLKTHYKKFVVIRNPWSHAVSQYFHDIDDHRFFKEVKESKRNLYKTFESYLKEGLYKRQSFYTFEDPLFVCDYFLQSEKLNESLKEICSSLNYSYKEIEENKVNRTSAATNYFQHSYPKNYRELYSDSEMIEIVAKASQNEINKFNYEF